MCWIRPVSMSKAEPCSSVISSRRSLRTEISIGSERASKAWWQAWFSTKVKKSSITTVVSTGSEQRTPKGQQSRILRGEKASKNKQRACGVFCPDGHDQGPDLRLGRRRLVWVNLECHKQRLHDEDEDIFGGLVHER